MALQHHFVVIVEDGKMWIDHDTTDNKFFYGSVWDSEIDDWVTNYEHATENEKAMELLWDRLNFGYDEFVGNLLDTMSEMKSTGDYHNDTLAEIEWKLTVPKEDRILPYKKPLTLPCQTCGVAVDKDTHKEELGFCVPCQHNYFNQEEKA